MSEQLRQLDPAELRQYKFVCRASAATSADKLLRKSVKEPKNVQRNYGETHIGSSPLMIFSEQRVVKDEVNQSRIAAGKQPIDQSTMYTVIVSDALVGRRLNQVLWEIAPSNYFGLDTSDIIYDWGRLLNKDPKYSNALARHESLGKAWKIFRHYAPRQLEDIKGGSTTTSIPIIRWVRNEAGQRKLFYSESILTNPVGEACANFIVETVGVKSHIKSVDPVVGLYVLALFSPDQRKDWPSKMGIHGKGRQTMGSTQAGLLTLVKDTDLANSPFLSAAEKKVKRGKIICRVMK